MRRLDLRPTQKLRNPARRLRQLARWPERIADDLPDAADLAGQRFWNFKIPVFSKVSDPPHATVDTQRACIAAIFAAAAAIEASPRRPVGCRIACLITTPFLFESEVALFFEEDYFASFLPLTDTRRTPYEGGWVEAGPADISVILELAPPAPAGLSFRGGTLLREFDESWGRAVERNNWVWSFPRR